MGKKITILNGSPRKNGNTAMLCDAFTEGAGSAGHRVTRFDLGHLQIHGCLGCMKGGKNPEAPCVQKDDYEKELKGLIKAADMIVFVMPLYYYNWPAQLKVVVDRFYSYTTELTAMHKKAALLAAAWDDTPDVFDVTRAYYRTICDYMEFTDCGAIYGQGCGTPDMTRATKYPQEAYRLGKSI